MKKMLLRIPEELVARVDRALRREGLDVLDSVFDSDVADAHVVVGQSPADVPRVLAYDGPVRKVA